MRTRGYVAASLLALAGCWSSSTTYRPALSLFDAGIGDDAGQDADPPADGNAPDAGAESGGSVDADAGDVLHDASTLDAGAVDGGAGEAGHEAGVDAATGPCNGGPLVVHADGLGDHWSDCVKLGTFDIQQSAKACVAFTGSASYCGPLGGSFQVTCSNQGGFPTCACWGYGSTYAGYVNPGAAGCELPNANSPQWQ